MLATIFARCLIADWLHAMTILSCRQATAQVSFRERTRWRGTGNAVRHARSYRLSSSQVKVALTTSRVIQTHI